MGCVSKYGLILANLACAIGFIIKDISESNILFDSIENSSEKRVIFSKIDSSGSSLYYAIDAITSFFSGFLFVFNPYLPMVLSLLTSFISLILSCQFIDITYKYNPKKSISFMKDIKCYIEELNEGFKFIFKSQRLRALIIFYVFFTTLLALLVNIQRSLLIELSVPDQYFGILFAIWGLTAAFSSTSSTRIQKRHGNHTLSLLGLTHTISITFIGLVAVLKGLPKFITFYIVFIMITLQNVIKGPFRTLIQRYLGSFSTPSLQTKISSASIFIESINRTIFSFVVSFLTDNFSTSLTTLIMGITSTILILIILNYMESRVGLKPEEYSESDINFKTLC